ncbi:hypothetical protein SAMN05216215_11139 [Saccharopolyspora shandongensis]|uniref:Uncharacterized protein n=1 Tax=Saccharopolyspora shandongensis TaxID=418495 RepID=A0A1H3U6G3_9PSEU|nr:hypothetical protein SAMN05216215_11139 [Saccharopolyspora shandongensis]
MWQLDFSKFELQAQIGELPTALGEAHVELRVWKKSASLILLILPVIGSVSWATSDVPAMRSASAMAGSAHRPPEPIASLTRSTIAAKGPVSI